MSGRAGPGRPVSSHPRTPSFRSHSSGGQRQGKPGASFPAPRTTPPHTTPPGTCCPHPCRHVCRGRSRSPSCFCQHVNRSGLPTLPPGPLPVSCWPHGGSALSSLPYLDAPAPLGTWKIPGADSQNAPEGKGGGLPEGPASRKSGKFCAGSAKRSGCHGTKADPRGGRPAGATGHTAGGQGGTPGRAGTGRMLRSQPADGRYPACCLPGGQSFAPDHTGCTSQSPARKYLPCPQPCALNKQDGGPNLTRATSDFLSSTGFLETHL